MKIFIYEKMLIQLHIFTGYFLNEAFSPWSFVLRVAF